MNEKLTTIQNIHYEINTNILLHGLYIDQYIILIKTVLKLKNTSIDIFIKWKSAIYIA